ncbi:hypothetical protein FB451DRAFT_1213848, partial [Mycena latifolia]
MPSHLLHVPLACACSKTVCTLFLCMHQALLHLPLASACSKCCCTFPLKLKFSLGLTRVPTYYCCMYQLAPGPRWNFFIATAQPAWSRCPV